MIVFYCDLDNTLIYSHRYEIGPDRVGVERYEGNEISFMTQASVSMLAKVRGQVLFVPTTTRTPQQYERVRLGDTPPEYALTCNGGILLRHGIPDDAWYRQTLSLIAPSTAALAAAAALLAEDADRSFEVRFLHDLFLFTKSNDPPETVRRLRMRLDTDQVSVFAQGSKIYVLPVQLTKAYGVSRLNRRLGNVLSLAAGDSQMDAGMLLAADKGFAPQTLAETLPRSSSIVAVPNDCIFSDEFLRQILEMNYHK